MKPMIEDVATDGEDTFLEEAFAAVKDDDLEGFKAAMRAAIESCMDSYGGDDEAA